MASPNTPTRVVLLYSALPSVSDERQARFLLRHAQGHQMNVVALAGRSPGAALATVQAGTAEAVLVAAEPPDQSLANMVAGVEQAGGWVSYARPTPRVKAGLDAETALVRTALANGGSPELVAQLLGVPLGQVRAIARTAVAPERPRVLVNLQRQREQRPRRAGGAA